MNKAERTISTQYKNQAEGKILFQVSVGSEFSLAQLSA
jgi:hypothetical protein